jgi:hypothetical protein
MLERWWFSFWEVVVAFWNSSFGAATISALIGSLAGAWGGALAAERIAAKRRVREQLLLEINQTNAAIELSHMICSAHLNLKEQHVREAWEDYQAKRRRVHAHHEGLRNGEIAPGTVLDIGQLDLRTLDVVRAKIEPLQGLVLGGLSLKGRPRPLVAILGQTMESLNNSIVSRNQMILAMRASNASLNERVAFYFALPREGFLDETFAGTMEAVHKQTDDCIYFSWRLCEDLTRHGKRVRAQFLKRQLKGPVPRIQTVLWKDVEAKGLLPAVVIYKSWEEGFLERVPETDGRRLRKWWYVARKRLRSVLRRPWRRKKKRECWQEGHRSRSLVPP